MEAVSSCDILPASYPDRVLCVICLNYRQGIPLVSRAESFGTLMVKQEPTCLLCQAPCKLHGRKDCVDSGLQATLTWNSSR